ncbi:MAG: flagellar biosynthesis protein FlgL [Gracilibacter sp. BRH_c7a]|nr:MAG: flagellar biosynthesis protein FlgL [Gracilibacter sp. BRH_c7a]
MRVTNNMLTQNLLKNLASANNRMDLIQNRLATGQEITKPSDDPVKIGTVLRFKSSLASMEQWKANAGEASAYMDTTEGILNNMTSMLQRVRELTVQGANGSNSDSDLVQIAKEVDQLTEQFQVLANSQVGPKYIFSGTQINKPPIPPNTPTVLTQWDGNDKAYEFEVGPNVSISVSVEGTRLFGITDNGDGTQSSSFFNTLHKLSSSLNNADQDQINEALQEIDDQIDNVLGLRAELGAKSNRMQTVSDQMDNSILSMKKSLSDIQDADMAETIMEFQSVQNVYRAALSVGSQIIQPSLVDFIR